jgi:hypothetical protein
VADAPDFRKLGASAIYEHEIPPFDPAQFFSLADLPPQEVGPAGGQTWLVRGQNFIMAYSQARAGERFIRPGHLNEYFVILPEDSAEALIQAGDEQVSAPAGSLTIVPPGDSALTMQADGVLVRIFSSLATDLAERCLNADAYRRPNPRVAPLVPFPDPTDGFRLRCYPFATHPATWYPSGQFAPSRAEDTRFGRYFRCTNLQVHLQSRVAPRDETHTFPHSTADFEHGAIQLSGERMHHVRTPWTPNIQHWRDDVHERLGSPGILIFPPGLIHTTQTLSPTSYSIDVYSPPRAQVPKPCTVINADEYPLPESTPDSLPNAGWVQAGHA